MMRPKKYLNYLQLEEQSEGNERRYEMLSDILNDGTFLPKTVEYKDIDQSFKEWVDGLSIISDEGHEFPTMSLFSNQRFSEYSQSWKYVDSNANLLLNFKTVLRENNPEYGNIQNKYWNIPGERFYLAKRKIVLDDNGSESFLDLKMKQPVAIDFEYKVSIFTTKYEKINEFNTLINKRFSARQDYIQPNGHYMPMILDSISDESQYNISDRQFYSQTYKIKVMGYIITEDSYRIEEHPLKVGVNFGMNIRKKKADVEIEEVDYLEFSGLTECGEIVTHTVPFKTGRILPAPQEEDEEENEDLLNYYYKPLKLTVTYDDICNIKKACFTIDEDMTVFAVQWENIRRIVDLQINGITEKWNLSEVSDENEKIFHEGDKIKITVSPIGGCGKIILMGYNPKEVFDQRLDNPEIESERTQFEEDYEKHANDEECNI